MPPTLSPGTDYTFRGWTEHQLRAAMTAVEPSSHWKDPILAWVPFHHFHITAAAIEFFTGTVARIVETDQAGHRYFVKAAGYRAGPCGDH